MKWLDARREPWQHLWGRAQWDRGLYPQREMRDFTFLSLPPLCAIRPIFFPSFSPPYCLRVWGLRQESEVNAAFELRIVRGVSNERGKCFLLLLLEWDDDAKKRRHLLAPNLVHISVLMILSLSAFEVMKCEANDGVCDGATAFTSNLCILWFGPKETWFTSRATSRHLCFHNSVLFLLSWSICTQFTLDLEGSCTCPIKECVLGQGFFLISFWLPWSALINSTAVLSLFLSFFC